MTRLAAILLLLITSPSHAGFVTAADLLSTCINGKNGSIEEDKQAQDIGTCEGFIMGAWDVITMRLNGDPMNPQICVSEEGVVLGDVSEKLIRYFQQDSIDLTKPAQEIIYEFFDDTYPCRVPNMVACLTYVIDIKSVVEKRFDSIPTKKNKMCRVFGLPKDQKEYFKSVCKTADSIDLSQFSDYEDFISKAGRQLHHEICREPLFY